MSEKDNFKIEKEFNAEALRETGKEHQERLDEARRERAEAQPEQSVEKARAEVEQVAHEKEKPRERAEKIPSKERQPATKQAKEASYKSIMNDAERHMSPARRSFSRFIHNPVVEKASEIVGATVAKPNAILAGSIFAFLFTLAIYTVARMYGYPLSGAETIASFAAGWLVGQLFDYFRVMITGKR